MSDISKLIGDRIRFFRQDRGYSQEQLALKANLNVSFLGQVERGIKKPTIDTLEKIVNSLEITFQELFDFQNRIDKREMSTVIDKLTFELNTRSEEEQAIIYDLVKQILKFRDKK